MNLIVDEDSVVGVTHHNAIRLHSVHAVVEEVIVVRGSNAKCSVVAIDGVVDDSVVVGIRDGKSSLPVDVVVLDGAIVGGMEDQAGFEAHSKAVDRQFGYVHPVRFNSNSAIACCSRYRGCIPIFTNEAYRLVNLDLSAVGATVDVDRIAWLGISHCHLYCRVVARTSSSNKKSCSPGVFREDGYGKTETAHENQRYQNETQFLSIHLLASSQSQLLIRIYSFLYDLRSAFKHYLQDDGALIPPVEAIPPPTKARIPPIAPVMPPNNKNDMITPTIPTAIAARGADLTPFSM